MTAFGTVLVIALEAVLFYYSKQMFQKMKDVQATLLCIASFTVVGVVGRFVFHMPVITIPLSVTAAVVAVILRLTKG